MKQFLKPFALAAALCLAGGLRAQCPDVDDLQAGDITFTSATLSWSGDAGTFAVRYAAVDGPWSDPAQADQSPFTLTGLRAGTHYTVEVRRVCSAEDTSAGVSLEFTTQECEAPEIESVTQVTENSALVAWRGEAMDYYVDYRKAGAIGGWDVGASEYEGNSFMLTGLEPATNYEVRVQARCADGVLSVPSTAMTFTTAQHVGIPAAAGAVSVELYPNPAHQDEAVELSLSGIEGQVEILVVDLSGRVVVRQTALATPANAHTLRLSSLPRGSYLVRIGSDRESWVKRLIVK